jgi:hypothetical protein
MSVHPAEQAPTALPCHDRFGHIAVRILQAQPAIMVSSQEFSALREVPTFPEVGGQDPGLWRGISGTSYRRPRFSGRVSARRIFNIRNFEVGRSETGWVFAETGSNPQSRARTTRRCGGHARILRGWENDQCFPGGTANASGGTGAVAAVEDFRDVTRPMICAV